MKPISIIIPTWNNFQYLNPCVRSILSNGILKDLADLIIVNNGEQPVDKEYGHIPQIKIVKPGRNVGWEGGLELGLKESRKSPVLIKASEH